VALVVSSKVEQRLDAVRAVLGAAKVTEVAGSIGVSRQTLNTWVTRYLLEGVAGLADRSHRPQSGSHETPRRCGSRWRSCSGSIRGGVRSGSGWSC
jgi:transposase-like protein